MAFMNMMLAKFSRKSFSLLKSYFWGHTRTNYLTLYRNPAIHYTIRTLIPRTI
jgi:hypothetical protein